MIWFKLCSILNFIKTNYITFLTFDPEITEYSVETYFNWKKRSDVFIPVMNFEKATKANEIILLLMLLLHVSQSLSKVFNTAKMSTPHYKFVTIHSTYIPLLIFKKNGTLKHLSHKTDCYDYFFYLVFKLVCFAVDNFIIHYIRKVIIITQLLWINSCLYIFISLLVFCFCCIRMITFKVLSTSQFLYLV